MTNSKIQINKDNLRELLLSMLDEEIEFNNKIRPHLSDINLGIEQAKSVIHKVLD